MYLCKFIYVYVLIYIGISINITSVDDRSRKMSFISSGEDIKKLTAGKIIFMYVYMHVFIHVFLIMHVFRYVYICISMNDHHLSKHHHHH
jgi:hypothetical protein